RSGTKLDRILRDDESGWKTFPSFGATSCGAQGLLLRPRILSACGRALSCQCRATELQESCRHAPCEASGELPASPLVPSVPHWNLLVILVQSHSLLPEAQSASAAPVDRSFAVPVPN